MSNSLSLATASIDAQNTFTDWVYPMADQQEFVRIWISGLADSTVTVQTTFDAGTTIGDVVQYAVIDSVNGSVQKIIEDFDKSYAYRSGIKTGDYGTDTVVCRIGF